MNEKLKDFLSVNLVMAFVVYKIGKDLVELYQSNEPGFGARLFIIIALVIATIFIYKLFIPWVASIASQHVAGIWIHSVPLMKRVMGNAVTNGCIWGCRWICRIGRSR
ncbi:TPA: hypothetical protein ACPZND_004349 [Yersinia enterocolitica]|nr:hypothetical protein [Yersinia enterocolitica]